MVVEKNHMTFMEIVKYGASPVMLAELRKQYQEQGYIHVKNFFDPFLADYFRTFITPDRFQKFFDSQPGVDHKVHDYSFAPEFIKEYQFMINQKNYVEFLQYVTDFSVGFMRGSAYVSDNSKKRGLLFHSDDDGNRYFLTSINITPEKYEGGVFTMRKAGNGEVLYQVSNNDSYGLLVAPVRSDLEHEVSDVIGNTTRIALVAFGVKEPRFKRFDSFSKNK